MNLSIRARARSLAALALFCLATAWAPFAAAQQMSIADASIVEGNAGTKYMVFTITLSAASASPVRVDVATSDGTATAGSDYLAASTPGLRFPAGMTSRSFVVSILSDMASESDETFNVNLSNAVGATISDAQGIGTITNDDIASGPTLSIADSRVSEGDSLNLVIEFTVSLSQPTDHAVFFDLATADGTASPNDYEGRSGRFFVRAGNTSETIGVLVNGDTQVEPDETFTITLSNVDGADLADGVATATIVNDDGIGPQPTLTVGDVSLVEGNSGTKDATFSVSLSAPAPADVSFHLTTDYASATAGSDFVNVDLVGIIPAGASSKDFAITVNGDTDVEPDEFFVVNITQIVGALVGDVQARGTIIDDDANPVFISVGDASVTEGDDGTKVMNFTVSLSAPSSTDVRYTAGASDLTATSGIDFAPMLVDYVLPAGATSQTVTVTLIGDIEPEEDETFTLSLFNVWGNVTVADGQGVGTILDDDYANAPSLSIGDVSISEGNSGWTIATFTISLSKPLTANMYFGLNVDGVTATAFEDFDPSGLNGWMGPGESSRTFEVTIFGDNKFEPDEAFTVTAVNVEGANVADGVAVGTILNDDPVPPTMSVGDASVTEGDSGLKTMTFPVTLSKPAPSQVCFLLQITGGTATVDSDYQDITVQPCIPAGQSSYDFNVSIIGDTVVESDETLLVSATLLSESAELLDGSATGMITNDDVSTNPELSIDDVAVVERDVGNADMWFTVRLAAPATRNVSFNIATSDGTAAASSDYQAKSESSRLILAGQTEARFNVSWTGDTNIEADETFNVTITNFDGATVVKGVGVGTLLNDDLANKPVMSIGDVSISEGDSGKKMANFVVSLSQASTAAASFEAQTFDGTAIAGQDYWYTVQDWSTMTIPAGQTSKVFSVPIVGDTTAEPDENFTVGLRSVTGATVGDVTAVGTIVNDDAISGPSLSINDVSIIEGDTGTKSLSFTVSLSAAASSAVSFDVATASGSALAGQDYVHLSLLGQTIAAGQTSKPVSVTINGDTTVEQDESFNINVSNVTGAFNADGQGVGTILDDDGVGAPSLSIGDVSISEGNSGTKNASFHVNLSAIAATNVCFQLHTADGTAVAALDYVQSGVSTCIAAGQTSMTFNVPIIGDTTIEPDETFTLIADSLSGATLGDGSATGTITDDDNPTGPTLSINDVSIAEGNSGTKTATFTVTLSAAQSTAVRFDMATANGTATAGSDYVARTTTGLRIPAGSTSKAFTVTINGDTTAEPDETFTVNLSNPVGATIADGQAICTISNDDAAATPTLSIADAAVSEGNSGTKTLTFTLSLSPAAAGTISYDIATSNATATAGNDYVASSLSGQTIAAGGTSKTFAVTINGDTTTEADETFTVTLSNVSGASLGDGTAIGSITNDDGGGSGPTLSIGDVTISEGNSLSKKATFTVTLSAPATSKVTYNIATANGTATAGSDYVAKSLTGQAILVGATSKVFVVAIKGDTVAEPNETFTVNVSSVVGATVADGQATGTISNDDAGIVSVARFDARGLYDDVDDGNREPVLTNKEYATLLLDTATTLCARTNAATVVAVDAVENPAALRDLADAANTLCAGTPRYQAVMGEGSSLGLLVEATSGTDARGVLALEAPSVDAKSGVTSLTVQASGHERPLTLLMPATLPTNAAARNAQLKALAQRVRAELKADPEARLVLIGGTTVPGLLDLTAREWARTGIRSEPLPGERVLVSQPLLVEFGATRIEFASPAANDLPTQVLQLKR